MANLSDLIMGFALTVITRYKRRTRVESSFFDRSSAKRIFTQKLESPGFQIEHQINREVDASYCVIQSKIHSKYNKH